MAKAVEIRPLRQEDDRSGFSCGQADLDRFFQHYAGQNQFKLHLAVSYVAVVDDRGVPGDGLDRGGTRGVSDQAASSVSDSPRR